MSSGALVRTKSHILFSLVTVDPSQVGAGSGVDGWISLQTVTTAGYSPRRNTSDYGTTIRAVEWATAVTLNAKKIFITVIKLSQSFTSLIMLT